jgi:hypothetical protein
MAAVTGASLAEVREAVRQDRADLGKFTKNGRHLPVGGLSDLEMIGAMHRLGWNIALSGRPLTPDRKMTKRNARKLCTLDEFAVEHGHDGPFVVCVTWHYVAIGWGEFCDTFTEVPVPLDAALRRHTGYGGNARRGAVWVRNWWKFSNGEVAFDAPGQEHALARWRARKGEFAKPDFSFSLSD